MAEYVPKKVSVRGPFVTALFSSGSWTNDPEVVRIRATPPDWKQFSVDFRKDVYTSSFAVSVWAGVPAGSYTVTTSLAGPKWNILHVTAQAQNVHDDRFTLSKTHGLWLYRTEPEGGFAENGERIPVIAVPEL